MGSLRWAIGRYKFLAPFENDEDWYIYDVKTDMTICDSPVRATLEMILELLAACEIVMELRQQAEDDNWYPARIVTELFKVYRVVDAILAKAKGE